MLAWSAAIGESANWAKRGKQRTRLGPPTLPRYSARDGELKVHSHLNPGAEFESAFALDAESESALAL